MRQEIIGGIGNIYRAELLFRAQIDPLRPGRDLARAQFDALWRDARALLRDGVRDGVIITTRPKDRPVKTPVACVAMAAPTSPSAMANPAASAPTPSACRSWPAANSTGARSARLAKCQTG